MQMIIPVSSSVVGADYPVSNGGFAVYSVATMPFRVRWLTVSPVSFGGGPAVYSRWNGYGRWSLPFIPILTALFCVSRHRSPDG